MNQRRFFQGICINHPKVFILLLSPVIFVVMAIGIYTQKHKVILPEFLDYEKKLAFNQMTMITQGIEKQIRELEMVSQNWLKKKVIWAAFIEKEGFEHLARSIESDTLETFFNIPLIQLVDDSGGILFTKGVNQNNITNKAFKVFRDSVLAGGHAYQSSIDLSFWSIIPGPEKPMIVCSSRYIQPGHDNGGGYFFLGYPLDLNKLTAQKNQDIRITVITESDTPSSESAAMTQDGVPEESYNRFDLSKSHLSLTGVFFNPAQQPLLEIRLKIPRDINVPINKITRIAALTICAVAVTMWIYFAAALLINRNTMHKQNQQIGLMLDQTQDWFSKLFHSRAVFVAITRLKNGEFFKVNPELISALGYEKEEELIGKTTIEMGAFEDQRDRELFTKIIREKGFVRDFYLKLNTRTHDTLYFSVSSDPIEYMGQKCLLNVLIDVTERKQLESDLKKSMFDAAQAAADAEIKNYQLELEMSQRNQLEKINQALFDISNAVNTSRDLDELYTDIHRILSSILTLENFYIADYDKEKDRVTFPYWHDEKNISREDVDNISKKISLTIEVIKSGKPLLANRKDFEPGGRFAEWGLTGDAASLWLGVPLKIKGEVIGVMVTQSYTKPDQFAPKDITLMEMVSDQVARAIERKRAQDALLQSEIKHRSIIESVQDGYCETDIYGRIIFFNDALCKISGYTKDELLGKNLGDLAVDTQNLNENLQQNPYSSETRMKIIQKNGQPKHIGIRPAPVLDVNGEQTGYRTFVRDIDEQKKYEEKLVFLAYHDTLTGLHNRKSFYEHLANVLDQAKRDPACVALVFMDIDKFKKVNDTLGHEKGDELLKEIASRLSEILRSTDYISRIGGDEFTVVTTSKSAFNPVEIAEKILEAIRLPYHLGKDTVDFVSASIGVSIFPDDSAEDAEDLVHQADQAMYEAKKTGDTFVFFKDI